MPAIAAACCVGIAVACETPLLLSDCTLSVAPTAEGQTAPCCPRGSAASAAEIWCAFLLHAQRKPSSCHCLRQGTGPEATVLERGQTSATVERTEQLYCRTPLSFRRFM